VQGEYRGETHGVSKKNIKGFQKKANRLKSIWALRGSGQASRSDKCGSKREGRNWERVILENLRRGISLNNPDLRPRGIIAGRGK